MIRVLAACLLLAACEAQPTPPAPPPADRFPSVERPVADIVSAQFSDEESRERLGEAGQVMDLMGIAAGDVVADIGAGRGYYTVRLAERVGPGGRVYAEDIIADTVDQLKGRVHAGGLANVTVILGTPDNPSLPAASIDHALLIHMYHEIENPYALLWHLRSSLKDGASIGIVDADRPTKNHGTPPWLLRCEVAAIGLAETGIHQLGDGVSYLAIFKAVRPRPRPLDIEPCRSGQ
jgi:SAM-dependent methyltransferase